MKAEGGCYCGDLRYEADGDALLRGQCHCRECQYMTGGGPLFVLGMPEGGFRYAKGAPKAFSRGDLDTPVTREFCENCGTHILSRAPSVPGMVLLKVGTLDDSSLFEGPQMAIFTCDKQPYHLIAEGLPTFERTPGG